MTEILSQMVIELNMDLIFPIMKIFRGNLLEEIIIMLLNLSKSINNLAREALSSGDKILSENYFQHADHFTRILNDQESLRKAKQSSEAEESKQLNDVNRIKEEVKMKRLERKLI